MRRLTYQKKQETEHRKQIFILVGGNCALDKKP